jgi:hypothetical protein
MPPDQPHSANMNRLQALPILTVAFFLGLPAHAQSPIEITEQDGVITPTEQHWSHVENEARARRSPGMRRA